MKKAIAFVLSACMLLTMCACGSNGEDSGSADKGDLNGSEVKAFVYSGADVYLKGITGYLIEQGVDGTDADLVIPNIIMAGTNEKDENDIKVWGIFNVSAYDLEGDTLVEKGAAPAKGVMHLKKEKDEWTVTKFEKGSDEATLKALCTGQAGVYDKILEWEKQTEEFRTNFLKMYSEDNGIVIYSYETVDGEKLDLYPMDQKNTQGVPEENFVPAGHYESNDGQGAKMDIRVTDDGQNKVSIEIINLVALRGSGTYENGALHFTADADDMGQMVTGEITAGDGWVELEITDSEYQYLDLGTTFKFVRKH